MTSTRGYAHELLYNPNDDISMAHTRIQKECVARTRMISKKVPKRSVEESQWEIMLLVRR